MYGVGIQPVTAQQFGHADDLHLRALGRTGAGERVGLQPPSERGVVIRTRNSW